MKKFIFPITLLLFLTCVAANAQWRSKTHDVYNALRKPAPINIDGELADDESWEGVFETVTGTNGERFCAVEFENLGTFEEHGNGKWDGPEDHETCFAIVWEPEAIYLALSVKDDEHEHVNGRVWDGDAAQLAFEPTGERDTDRTDILYNVGLDNNAQNVLLDNEVVRGNPGLVIGESVAIVRNKNEKETYYEFMITPENLGLKDPFSEGYEFGLGICVNDGDQGEGQGGQKGWSGWYPHSIVHGKNPDKTGLVRLTDDTLAVEAANKLATTWGKLKSTR